MIKIEKTDMIPTKIQLNLQEVDSLLNEYYLSKDNINSIKEILDCVYNTINKKEYELNLKKCPFCGSKGKIIETKINNGTVDVSYVECQGDYTHSSKYSNNLKDAFDSWNNRKMELYLLIKGKYHLRVLNTDKEYNFLKINDIIIVDIIRDEWRIDVYNIITKEHKILKYEELDKILNHFQFEIIKKEN
ncbi:MAG: hypothetical protein BV457_08440 [Thermoplasmata archaeon M9B1D]|nr:MAG: hypothetical protein BV457_08440 [Thermoplasmata archaeon M9B1D]